MVSANNKTQTLETQSFNLFKCRQFRRYEECVYSFPWKSRRSMSARLFKYIPKNYRQFNLNNYGSKLIPGFLLPTYLLKRNLLIYVCSYIEAVLKIQNDSSHSDNYYGLFDYIVMWMVWSGPVPLCLYAIWISLNCQNSFNCLVN